MSDRDSLNDRLSAILSADRIADDWSAFDGRSFSETDGDTLRHLLSASMAQDAVARARQTFADLDEVRRTLTTVGPRTGRLLFAMAGMAMLVSTALFYGGYAWLKTATVAFSMSLVPLACTLLAAVLAARKGALEDKLSDATGPMISRLTKQDTEFAAALEPNLSALADRPGGPSAFERTAYFFRALSIGEAARRYAALVAQESQSLSAELRRQTERSRLSPDRVAEGAMAGLGTIAAVFLAATLFPPANLLWSGAHALAVVVFGAGMHQLAQHTVRTQIAIQQDVLDRAFTHRASGARWTDRLLRHDASLRLATAIHASLNETSGRPDRSGPSAAMLSGRDLHRLRLSVAPVDEADRRFGRPVWQP